MISIWNLVEGVPGRQNGVDRDSYESLLQNVEIERYKRLYREISTIVLVEKIKTYRSKSKSMSQVAKIRLRDRPIM